MTLYDKLGVKTDAKPADIKHAYRKKAKDTHPDKNGGNQEKFVEIHNAYMILSDPSLRSKYDATGDETLKQADNSQQEIMTIIAGALETIIGAIEAKGQCPLQYDIIGEMKSAIAKRIEDTERHLHQCRKTIEKTQKLMGRFRIKKGVNFIEQMLKAKIDNITVTIGITERQLEPVKKAYDLLRDVEFDMEKPTPQHNQAEALAQFLGGRMGAHF